MDDELLLLPPPLSRRDAVSRSTLATSEAMEACAEASSGAKGNASIDRCSADTSGVSSEAVSESSSARTSALTLLHGSLDGSERPLVVSYRDWLAKVEPTLS